ncbi:MAG: hypothetical protein AABZ13_01585, partial [Planctomycetota bacterium]
MRAKKSAISNQRSAVSKRKKLKAESLELTAKSVTIHGTAKGKRVPSRILEEQIQQAVQEGNRELHIISDGQHGIGGRIWPKGKTVKITVEGPVGQRLGSMGMPGTE